MSLYFNNLEEWMRYFTRDQILVLSYDEVRMKPEIAQKRIRKFVGSDFTGNLPIIQSNESSSKIFQMSCSTQTKIDKIFNDQTEKLYSFLKNNPGSEMEQRPFPVFEKGSCEEPKYKRNGKLIKDYRLPNIQILGSRAGIFAVSTLTLY